MQKDAPQNHGAPGEQRHSETTSLGHVHEWEALAVDLLAGKASAEERALAETHLESCAACRSTLEELQWAASLCSVISPEDPPFDLAPRVLEATQAALRSKSIPTHKVPWWRRYLDPVLRPSGLALAAAVLTVLLVGSLTVWAQLNARLQQTPVRLTTLAAQESQEGAAAGQTQQPSQSGATDRAVGGKGDITHSTEQVPESGIPSTTGAVLASTTAASALLRLGVPEPIWTLFSFNGSYGHRAASAFRDHTGLVPLPEDQWVGGPTFAALVYTRQATELVTYLVSEGFDMNTAAEPIDVLGNAVNLIVAGYESYPTLRLEGSLLRVEPRLSSEISPSEWSFIVFFTLLDKTQTT